MQEKNVSITHPIGYNRGGTVVCTRGERESTNIATAGNLGITSTIILKVGDCGTTTNILSCIVTICGLLTANRRSWREH